MSANKIEIKRHPAVFNRDAFFDDATRIFEEPCSPAERDFRYAPTPMARALHFVPTSWLRGMRSLLQFKPMIDKTKIIDTVRERLKKLPNGHYLDLRTYKRNRSVVIVKIDADNLLVIEDGYFNQRFQIKTEKLKKLLKTLLKKEFPRSHKIRLYVMGRFAEDELGQINRKIL